MKTTYRLTTSCLTMAALLVSMPALPAFSQSVAARNRKPVPVHYAVLDIGTFGGNFSQAYGLNNQGDVGGGATLPDGTMHAFLWTDPMGLQDLGTLGGPNAVADSPNRKDEVPIISEVPDIDPYVENFCMFFTNHRCIGAVWQDGSLTPLPTLGGNNAEAFAINDQGVVAGFSETRVKDTTCASAMPSQVFRYEAVVWSPEGEIHRMRPLVGDTVAYAWAINNSGQVVGASGLCSNTSIPPAPSGPHAVLWERDGTPIDLGGLSGPLYNVAASINEKGEVVGGSLAADGTIHAFLWTRTTGMIDLGAYPGAAVTVAPCCNTNNNNGPIVGFSIDGTTGNSRALLWQNLQIYDLNGLIPTNSPWYLQQALSINDAGEIAGFGLIGGNVHAFFAIPCDKAHAESAACLESW
jgi:probable HAF family extracellular repeat protein